MVIFPLAALDKILMISFSSSNIASVFFSYFIKELGLGN